MHAWQSPHGRILPVIGSRTLIMGVLNVTPDSFSDGGQLMSPAAAVDRAGALLAAGADVLDLGGESTRPGSAPVSVAEELDRVLPALAVIRQAFPAIPLSIDTYKPEVAAESVAAGADLINDIWGAAHGFTGEERKHWQAAVQAGAAPPVPRPSAMAETAARLRCPIILMHNRPNRDYQDFWTDVLLDLRLSVALARAAGVPDHQIWLDPGFGFAKEPPHNLEVLRQLRRIAALGYPVLVGTSRKSTIGRVLGAPVHARQAGTGATVVWAIQQGCRMIRVHDVAEMVCYARMADAINAGLAFA
ncbi:MAG: dihydropteroate synthase [Verrucomicrobia bacterium]|nr:dihydropteroate synthase [Verrucomicrobiota bacterium]